MADVDELVGTRPEIPSYRATILKHLKNGDYGYYARLEGRIVSYAWYQVKQWEFDRGLRFTVPEKSVYSMDSYTLPEFRGLGLNIGVINFANRNLVEMGYVSDFYLIKTDNISSLRVATKVDNAPLGVVAYKRRMMVPFYSIESNSADLERIKRYFVK